MPHGLHEMRRLLRPMIPWRGVSVSQFVYNVPAPCKSGCTNRVLFGVGQKHCIIRGPDSPGFDAAFAKLLWPLIKLLYRMYACTHSVFSYSTFGCQFIVGSCLTILYELTEIRIGLQHCRNLVFVLLFCHRIQPIDSINKNRIFSDLPITY